MSLLQNLIGNELHESPECGVLEKYDPHTGQLQATVVDSSSNDVDAAVRVADKAFHAWSEMTSVQRGRVLFAVVAELKLNEEPLAQVVAKETGKPVADARGEVSGAISQGEYFAGEGARFYGRSLNSTLSGKRSFTIRHPLGVAGLIVPANTPIANIAWKVFPALICGNTVVLKASEDAPETANFFAELAYKAGLPSGVLNIIHGRGSGAGTDLVSHPKVKVISFTGSTAVGKSIAALVAHDLTRLSLELGGKNPFIVWEDADLEESVKWAASSAFSNAGQRCASASRILVHKNIYHNFKKLFIARASELKLGISAGCDLGPVINHRQHVRVLKLLEDAMSRGAKLLCGGSIPELEELRNGYYIEPTVLEGLDSTDSLNETEIFGPVASIECFESMKEALEVANRGPYGLTVAFHTSDIDRALWFSERARAGVININIGTYGSEPHMPFGGFGLSGNGTREPGLKALDVYSEIKNISLVTKADYH